MTSAFREGSWALILGGSSGFGLATARKLGEQGMNLFIVHRDRRGAMRAIEPEFEKLRDLGVGFHSWNTDATSEEPRAKVIDAIAELIGEGRIRVLLHSIAFGNLKETGGVIEGLFPPTKYTKLYILNSKIYSMFCKAV